MTLVRVGIQLTQCTCSIQPSFYQFHQDRKQPAAKAFLKKRDPPSALSSKASLAWKALFAGKRNQVDECRILRNQISHTYAANDLKTALLHAEDIPKEVKRFLKLAFTFVTGCRCTDVSGTYLKSV